MVESGEIAVFQVDGRLNPSDAFTKHLDKLSRKMHYLFLMGQPEEARRVWLSSSVYKTYKPKKITPVPAPPIELPSSVTAKLKQMDRTVPTESSPSFSES